MFLHVSVILLTGGGSPVRENPHPGQGEPPLEQTPPPTPGADPPGQGEPPRADTPPQQTPPPPKQTAAYGQRAAGTHPTGMHSSFVYTFTHVVP